MRAINCIAANRWSAAVFLYGAAVLAMPAGAAPVIVPDNGFGTAQMPILADYTAQTPMQIINGLPGGATIDIAAVLKAPPLYVEVPGGGFPGGTKSGGGTGILFTWQMQGTGPMSAYSRNFNFPASTSNILSFAAAPFIANPASFEVHAAPRTNNAPLQLFATDMFRLFSQISNPGAGDPDFDLLRIVAGSDFGLPGPGLTRLQQSGPNWAVDSFFDITYRIDFVGRPGGPFGGMSGSTTGTTRISLGDPIILIPEPASCTLLSFGTIALATRIRQRRPRRRD